MLVDSWRRLELAPIRSAYDSGSSLIGQTGRRRGERGDAKKSHSLNARDIPLTECRFATDDDVL